MKLNEQQLKAFLLDSNLVTESQLNEAQTIAKKNKKKLGDELVKLGIVNETQLAKVYAYLLGIPFVSLEKTKIQPDTLKIIPEAIAKALERSTIEKTIEDFSFNSAQSSQHRWAYHHFCI